MKSSLVHMLVNMSLPVRVILVLLCGMSIYSLGVALERGWRFAQARRQSVGFVSAVGSLLRLGKIPEALARARLYKSSHVARVISAGLVEFEHEEAQGLMRGAELLAAVRRATEREGMAVTTDLRRGMGGLATIASTSPFVGLLGTVLGIIDAFHAMSALEAGPELQKAVSAGISEALIGTAIGLFVAIPAVFLYNHFLHALDGFQVEISHAVSELTGFLTRRELARAA